MKNPVTPAGIEPATFRFVAQHLNHCATAVPSNNLIIIIVFWRVKISCRKNFTLSQLDVTASIHAWQPTSCWIMELHYVNNALAKHCLLFIAVKGTFHSSSLCTSSREMALWILPETAGFIASTQGRDIILSDNLHPLFTQNVPRDGR